MRSPIGLSLRGAGLVTFPAGLPVRSSVVFAALLAVVAEAGARAAATGLRDERERRRNKPTGLLPLSPAPLALTLAAGGEPYEGEDDCWPCSHERTEERLGPLFVLPLS